jgi:hypothetical protein
MMQLVTPQSDSSDEFGPGPTTVIGDGPAVMAPDEFLMPEELL